MNEMITEVSRNSQTPIEIALQVDNEGNTTAKKLYEFLELNPINYGRWFKKQIILNVFAEVNIDFWPINKVFFLKEENYINGRPDINIFFLKEENPLGGRPTADCRLSASFAKRLAMASGSQKGEITRQYFIKVEDSLKKVATAKVPVVESLTPYVMAYMEKTNAALEVLNQKIDEIKDLHDPEIIKKRQEEARRKHDEFMAYCRSVGVNPNDL